MPGFQDYKVERRPFVPQQDPEIEHAYLYQQANSGWTLCAVFLDAATDELVYYWGSGQY